MKWLKFVVPVLIFVVYGCLVFKESKKPEIEVTFSGYVLAKHDFDKKKKSGDYSKILYLECKNDKERKTFKVDPTTYFKYNPGDKISFENKIFFWIDNRRFG